MAPMVGYSIIFQIHGYIVTPINNSIVLVFDPKTIPVGMNIKRSMMKANAQAVSGCIVGFRKQALKSVSQRRMSSPGYVILRFQILVRCWSFTPPKVILGSFSPDVNSFIGVDHQVCRLDPSHTNLGSFSGLSTRAWGTWWACGKNLINHEYKGKG